MNAYQQFIASGGLDQDWEKYQAQKNAEIRQAGKNRMLKALKNGQEISGNDLALLIGYRNIPEKHLKNIQHDDTVISMNSVQARGLNRNQAEKLLIFVHEAIEKYENSQ